MGHASRSRWRTFSRPSGGRPSRSRRSGRTPGELAYFNSIFGGDRSARPEVQSPYSTTTVSALLKRPTSWPAADTPITAHPVAAPAPS